MYLLRLYRPYEKSFLFCKSYNQAVEKAKELVEYDEWHTVTIIKGDFNTPQPINDVLKSFHACGKHGDGLQGSAPAKYRILCEKICQLSNDKLHYEGSNITHPHFYQVVKLTLWALNEPLTEDERANVFNALLKSCNHYDKACNIFYYDHCEIHCDIKIFF